MVGLVTAPGLAAFVTFESGQVRPLALSPDRSRLFAVNTPDARLEIFALDGGGATPIGSVEVGLEPVAVAARTNDEVWVVNHLSDSISVVDVGATPARVVRTLLVGDEPRDVVFAGLRGADGFFTRAFVTTARLGQNLPPSVPIEATTPGMPRALVHVFDAEQLGAALGGTPLTVIALFGDTPRALAASADGATVYAAVFQSGNRTTVVTESAVCDGGAASPPCDIDGVQVPDGLDGGRAPGGLPPPNAAVDGTPAPEVGLIVRHNPTTGRWEDELGRNWTNAVRFDLPDLDVFRIDALADPPREVGAIAEVGTVLFNIAVNPVNGKLYVTNTEARNEVRFEGPGTIATTVRGHLHESRISIVDGTAVAARHLNKHITALPLGYRTVPMPAQVKEASLAIPLDLTFAGDGTLYVAAFGSSKVGIFATAELEADSFTPSPHTHVEVSGGGPAGLALDEARHRLYVLTRFDNAVKVIDTDTRQQIAQHRLHNPEPASVVAGRPLLYDARATSSNGEGSCAACHVFGDFDSLAWDLGDPDEHSTPNFNPLGPTGSREPFHPMKGPMTTQTLRGMKHQGPMHWRGDRTGAEFNSDPRALDSAIAFSRFNAAFEALNGRDEGEISEADMEAFTEFILQVVPPPNPIRDLDNNLTPAQQVGRDVFLDRRIFADAAAHCAGCHTLEPGNGHFGTLGQSTFSDEPQQFKVPQLKNAYQKIGMFGTPKGFFVNALPEHAQHQGAQIRGFGFLHDGSVATIFDFLRTRSFTLSDQQRRQLEQYVLAFDTTFAPIVGQQVTQAAAADEEVAARVALLIARARTPFELVDHPGAHECDLVAKGVIDGAARGYLLDAASGTFRTDRLTEAPLSEAALRALAAVEGQAVTYTCVPPGEGVRLGLDRDGDSVRDRDEIDAGSDPADPRDPFEVSPTPTVTPTATATRTITPTQSVTVKGDADCNLSVDQRDIAATIAVVFDPRLARLCDADCNDDGKITAADVACVSGVLADG
jgi:DNA-binding beta-propeller fold protein YncE